MPKVVPSENEVMGQIRIATARVPRLISAATMVVGQLREEVGLQVIN